MILGGYGAVNLISPSRNLSAVLSLLLLDLMKTK
jgi:hypothetical protein